MAFKFCYPNVKIPELKILKSKTLNACYRSLHCKKVRENRSGFCFLTGKSGNFILKLLAILLKIQDIKVVIHD